MTEKLTTACSHWPQVSHPHGPPNRHRAHALGLRQPCAASRVVVRNKRRMKVPVGLAERPPWTTNGPSVLNPPPDMGWKGDWAALSRVRQNSETLANATQVERRLHAAFALARCSHEKANRVALALSPGLLEAVAHVLQRAEPSESGRRCQLHCLTVLHNILLESAKVDVFIGHDEGVLRGLLRCMNEDDIAQQELSVTCLDFLSISEANQPVLCHEQGLLEGLAHLLQTTSSGYAVYHALHTLTYLTTCRRNHHRMVHSREVISVVLDTLRGHAEDPARCQQGLVALCNLLSEPVHAAALDAAYGIRALVALVQSQTPDSDVASYCAEALLRLNTDAGHLVGGTPGPSHQSSASGQDTDLPESDHDPAVQLLHSAPPHPPQAALLPSGASGGAPSSAATAALTAGSASGAAMCSGGPPSAAGSSAAAAEWERLASSIADDWQLLRAGLPPAPGEPADAGARDPTVSPPKPPPYGAVSAIPPSRPTEEAAATGIQSARSQPAPPAAAQPSTDRAPSCALSPIPPPTAPLPGAATATPQEALALLDRYEAELRAAMAEMHKGNEITLGSYPTLGAAPQHLSPRGSSACGSHLAGESCGGSRLGSISGSHHDAAPPGARFASGSSGSCGAGGAWAPSGAGNPPPPGGTYAAAFGLCGSAAGSSASASNVSPQRRPTERSASPQPHPPRQDPPAPPPRQSAGRHGADAPRWAGASPGAVSELWSVSESAESDI
eukprot:TRINITY_DN22456_c0_g1_i1.p1 TRINITY_DN22456_c0_g1~~TRINITY_DN22456_c0_g1_i1.p1  ORF type:complete len:730 (+),score=135.17 TRINITY_DN22456_c0_g1_i1:147-2336(+)